MSRAITVPATHVTDAEPAGLRYEPCRYPTGGGRWPTWNQAASRGRRPKRRMSRPAPSAASPTSDHSRALNPVKASRPALAEPGAVDADRVAVTPSTSAGADVEPDAAPTYAAVTASVLAEVAVAAELVVPVAAGAAAGVAAGVV